MINREQFSNQPVCVKNTSYMNEKIEQRIPIKRSKHKVTIYWTCLVISRSSFCRLRRGWLRLDPPRTTRHRGRGHQRGQRVRHPNGKRLLVSGKLQNPLTSLSLSCYLKLLLEMRIAFVSTNVIKTVTYFS